MLGGGSSIPPPTKAEAWSWGQEPHPAWEHLTSVAAWGQQRSVSLSRPAGTASYEAWEEDQGQAAWA